MGTPVDRIPEPFGPFKGTGQFGFIVAGEQHRPGDLIELKVFPYLHNQVFLTLGVLENHEKDYERFFEIVEGHGSVPKKRKPFRWIEP
jgi:hypothetical protein